MRPKRSVAAVAAIIVLTGCAESTLVRSYPPGAKLYINNQFEGVTPIAISIPRAQFDAGQITYRAERDGYAPGEGTLRTTTCGGRIAGGIFTLGVMFLFKRPTCFTARQDISLAPLPGQTVGIESAPRQPTIDERLERIKRLHDEGTITDEEYEHYRQEILKGL